MDQPGNSWINAWDFGAIIDLLPCYLSIQDRYLRILYTNQNFKDDFGDGIGKLCHAIYKKNPERCEDCPVQKTFTDKKVHLSEETVRLKNGGTAQLIVYSAPMLNAAGEVTAVIEMSTNITKLKVMQDELAHLGQSFAILSHDIKNMLEGLQGGGYVVEEGLKDRDENLTMKGWRVVKKNIDELSRLTKNILYSSKKRSGNYRHVAPDQIVNEISGLFQDKASAMNIRLMQQTNPQLPMIILDPDGIRRMLSNLVWNAMEACGKDKKNSIKMVVVRADFYDEHHLMFEVEDNGIGMDETIRHNVFNKFYSTKGNDGTGLGLFVVDKIVKEHGGRIEVLSNPGIGSRFRVIFRMRGAFFCYPASSFLPGPKSRIPA
jgi:signal transduction histidine kinase